jgi:hypothetical protein
VAPALVGRTIDRLTLEKNLADLAALIRDLLARAEAIGSPGRVVLDMDSTEIRVYGHNCAPATSIAPTAGRNCCCRD